jgi:glycosyltransferase involved in cell wall biosynthesis
MRILHVTPCYLPGRSYGGPIASVHGLARALVRRGHEVSVFTTDLDGWEPLDPAPGEQAEIDGVDVRYFSARPAYVGRRIHRAPALREALRRRLPEFDVVQAHGLFTWPTTCAAREAEHAGVPFVLSPRGMLVRDLIRRRGRLRKELWLHAFDRRTFERAALVHATSELEARELRRFAFACRPIETIPNGVDHEPFDDDAGELSPCVRALVERDDLILFLGRINWKKGLDRLLEAVVRLDAGHLVVAGDDHGYRAELERLVRERGVSDRVTFTGPVVGRDKAALLERASVLALVSDNENFGNVVLEALAAALPVVVTHGVGAAPIVESAGAGLVVDGEPSAIASALECILADRTAAHALGEAGRAEVRTRYTWDVVAAAFERAYAGLTRRFDVFAA